MKWLLRRRRSRLPPACGQTKSWRLHRRAPLARGRATLGACGVTRFTPRFLHGATFPFLELFARGDIRRHSGQLSRALRVGFVRPRPRPAADRIRRQEPRCAGPGVARFEGLHRAGAEPPRLAGGSRQGVCCARAATQLDPITTNFVGVLARNGRKGELRNVIRAFGRLAAEHRGEATAEVVTARPLNDDQLAHFGSSSGPAPAATSPSTRRSTPTSSAKSW